MTVPATITLSTYTDTTKAVHKATFVVARCLLLEASVRP